MLAITRIFYWLFIEVLTHFAKSHLNLVSQRKTVSNAAKGSTVVGHSHLTTAKHALEARTSSESLLHTSNTQ